MATLSLEQRLADAEAAYHDLLTGKAVAEVRDANGETLRYTQANRGALSAYISAMKRELGGAAQGPLWFGG